jgi:thiol-disulfide isomerase/thioredoxin
MQSHWAFGMTSQDTVRSTRIPSWLKLAAIGCLSLAAGLGIGSVVRDAVWPGKTIDIADKPIRVGGKTGLQNLVVHQASKPLPDVQFQDEAGRSQSFANWRGRVVLVNLWATWCAPCKVEMPSLDRLQQRLGGDAFEVVAVATDRTGSKEPRAFLEKAGIRALKLYYDDTSQIVRTLKSEGLPVTLILNRDGAEVARLLGTAEWDSDEAVAILRRIIER